MQRQEDRKWDRIGQERGEDGTLVIGEERRGEDGKGEERREKERGEGENRR